MKSALLIVGVLGILVANGWSESDVPPARLANGQLIEGSIQATNSEGLLIATPRGELTYPWKYLSVGTRYRHERPLREKQGLSANAALQASAVSEPAAPASSPTSTVASPD